MKENKYIELKVTEEEKRFIETMEHLKELRLNLLGLPKELICPNGETANTLGSNPSVRKNL